ncbi:MAG: ribosome-associated translation inhibitor RaiA [Bacteroidetes bacterium]|nr:MAG: ribosome-associated translation inhibitor RaiA [Bacteroidota bacterium]
MKLDIQSIHFDADQKLLDFIQKKCDKLETFFDRITHGEVFLRLEKGDHSRENKVVEIRLHIPGTTIFATEQNTSFEAATDLAMEALRTQLTRAKEKMKDH